MFDEVDEDLTKIHHIRPEFVILKGTRARAQGKYLPLTLNYLDIE